jgi:hypothetical protein
MASGLAGIMVGVLIGSPVLGLAGTLGPFIAIGVLLAILGGVVYLLSRPPTMHLLTLRLSFLEWRRHRARAAFTLLAMAHLCRENDTTSGDLGSALESTARLTQVRTPLIQT